MFHVTSSKTKPMSFELIITKLRSKMAENVMVELEVQSWRCRAGGAIDLHHRDISMLTHKMLKMLKYTGFVCVPPCIFLTLPA